MHAVSAAKSRYERSGRPGRRRRSTSLDAALMPSLWNRSAISRTASVIHDGGWAIRVFRGGTRSSSERWSGRPRRRTLRRRHPHRQSGHSSDNSERPLQTDGCRAGPNTERQLRSRADVQLGRITGVRCTLETGRSSWTGGGVAQVTALALTEWVLPTLCSHSARVKADCDNSGTAPRRTDGSCPGLTIRQLNATMGRSPALPVACKGRERSQLAARPSFLTVNTLRTHNIAYDRAIRSLPQSPLLL